VVSVLPDLMPLGDPTSSISFTTAPMRRGTTTARAVAQICCEALDAPEVCMAALQTFATTFATTFSTTIARTIAKS